MIIQENLPLKKSLSENLEMLKTICDNSADLIINEITICGINIACVFCEGMISSELVSRMLINPLTSLFIPEAQPNSLKSHIDTHLLLSIDRGEVYDTETLFEMLYSGFGILLIDGLDTASYLGFQGFISRGVSEPETEANISGAHEGFVEPVRANMSLIRRRIKSPLLKFEFIKKGGVSRTSLCLCYMRDRVPEKLLNEIKAALDDIDLEVLLSTGYVKPFLEPGTNSIFDSVGSTERPDVLCAKLTEGRVGIMIDSVPFVLVVPKLLNESFQTLDDYNFKPYFSTSIRWIKYFAFFIAVLLPGLYLAAVLYHPELLNSKLILILANAEKNVPFPLLAETIGILVMYEVIREAGIRLPKAVGGSVSIIAGLIIGDAAVRSGFISTPLLTVAALSIISGFITPDLHQPVTVLRVLFTAAAGFFGMFGIGLSGALVLFNMCATQDFGFPITAPISPLSPRALRDIVSTSNFRKMKNKPFTVESLL